MPPVQRPKPIQFGMLGVPTFGCVDNHIPPCRTLHQETAADVEHLSASAASKAAR